MATKRTILVIDDSAEILALFHDLLEEEGYRVITSSYTLRQLDTIIAEQPDLVILDLMFGNEVTGWNTLQMMKLHRDTAAIPVIVCTAEIGKAAEIQGFLTEHNVRLLLKPFTIPELFASVNRVMKRL